MLAQGASPGTAARATDGPSPGGAADAVTPCDLSLVASVALSGLRREKWGVGNGSQGLAPLAID